MNVCYLHIGAPKTGTSAIQDFLLTNQDYLYANGFVYPNPGLHKDDRQANDGNSKSILKAILHDDRDLASELNNTLRSLLKSENVILSAEDLFNRAYENGFDIIRCILKDVEVKVILYVRLQSEIFESAIKQRIRNHNKTDYEIPQEFYKKFDWFNCAALWAAEFGRGNVAVREYKSKKSDISIEADFLNVLGIQNNLDKYNKERESINESLTGMQLEFMRLVNGLNLEDKSFNRIKDAVINTFKFEVGSESWCLQRNKVREVNQHFKESNEKLFKCYGVKIIP